MATVNSAKKAQEVEQAYAQVAETKRRQEEKCGRNTKKQASVNSPYLSKGFNNVSR